MLRKVWFAEAITILKRVEIESHGTINMLGVILFRGHNDQVRDSILLNGPLFHNPMDLMKDAIGEIAEVVHTNPFKGPSIYRTVLMVNGPDAISTSSPADLVAIDCPNGE